MESITIRYGWRSIWWSALLEEYQPQQGDVMLTLNGYGVCTESPYRQTVHGAAGKVHHTEDLGAGCRVAGSGILAITAALLGAKEIKGDIDEVAVKSG